MGIWSGERKLLYWIDDEFSKMPLLRSSFSIFRLRYKNIAPMGLNNFRSQFKTLGSSGTKIQQAIDFFSSVA
jgi:hypothetical protein